MKYAGEMDSGAMMYKPNFIKIGSGIPALGKLAKYPGSFMLSAIKLYGVVLQAGLARRITRNRTTDSGSTTESEQRQAYNSLPQQQYKCHFVGLTTRAHTPSDEYIRASICRCYSPAYVRLCEGTVSFRMDNLWHCAIQPPG
jgi:hypothetical protein